MTPQKIIIPLKRFLLMEQCPADWKGLDLYLFRDETVVFYVGQSRFAFARVWEHLLGGFKGHSMMGRFVPLPSCYSPPNAPWRRRQSLNRLIHEAERAVKSEDDQLWVRDMESSDCYAASTTQSPAVKSHLYIDEEGELR